MTKQKYKEGDRVRLVSGIYDEPGHFVGALATVTVVDPKLDHGVRVSADGGDGESWFYLLGEIMPAEPEVIRDNPLPYEVWIGDRLIAAFQSQELRHALIGYIRDNVQIYTKENYSG